MALGLIGKKIGMTRVFDQEAGISIPVTVIDVADNSIVQIKTADKHGYSAVQVGFDSQKESRLSRPVAGHLKANGAQPVRKLKEFRLNSDAELPEAGAAHPGMDTFAVGAFVDVIGTTKGKGFQGVVKRFHFQGQCDTHGSMMHRRPGSIGCSSTPGRVWKNRKMPGRHGNFSRTVQNLKVVQVRSEDKVILVSGAVPGARGSYLVIRPAIKKQAK